jgi:hypothetical protein
MRIILFLCALLSFCAISSAQDSTPSIYYIYDNAGNRTGRIIIEEESSGNKIARRDNSDNGEDDNSNVDLDSATTDIRVSREVKIYPNPTANLLHIKIMDDNISALHYIFYGNNGVKLLSGDLNNETILQISGYSCGVYYLNIFNGAENRVWKIIKR